MQRLREIALQHTDLAKAISATIRARLLKIGAAVIRNTRRIRSCLPPAIRCAISTSPPPTPWRLHSNIRVRPRHADLRGLGKVRLKFAYLIKT